MSESDPRPLLLRSLAQAAQIVDGVSTDQLTLPTPCSEFDVTALLTHMVGVVNRIAALGRGEIQTGPPPAPVGVAPDGWPAAFDQSRGQATAAWAPDDVLDRKCELPFGTFDGATVAGIYLMELTTHSWDLARATGQVARLDDTLAEAAMPVAQRMLPPEPRGGFVPFGPIVAVGPNASPYEQLASFLGRRVS